MWACPSCGSNNELVACWRCHQPRPAPAFDEPGPSSDVPTGVTLRSQPGSSQAASLQTTPLQATAWQATPPGVTPGFYPGWNATPHQTRSRRASLVLMMVLAFIVAAGVLGFAVLRPIVQLGSTTALAAPASIDGLPRTADLSSQGVTVMGRRILNVASATYGSGDVRYAVVAMSGGQLFADSRVMVDAMAPQVAGDSSLDSASAAHIPRGGIDYTCWRMNGAVAGVTCEWNADSVTGVIVQVGSADTGRCVTFAEAARHALQPA